MILPWRFMRRAFRDVAMQFEHGLDERHVEPDDELCVDGAGWLQGPGVRYDASPKSSRAPILESTGPVLVVSHGTATARVDQGGHPIAPALLAAIRKAGGRDASWHLLVDPEGTVWQSIPLLRGAWHAGSESAARVVIGTRRVAVNLCSVGIEYINAGEVRRVDSVWSTRRLAWGTAEPAWRSWPFGGQKPSASAPDGRGPGPVIPQAEIVPVGQRWYHAYTEAQFEARRRVHDALLARWPRLGEEVTLEHPSGNRTTVTGLSCGHIDVDPRRKPDPYPTFTTQRKV